MRPPCPSFSPCWCEQNPTNPRCVPTLEINNELLCVVITILIITVVFFTIKKKNYEKQL
jgi:hypothetical protein